jgi:hypothetical protein
MFFPDDVNVTKKGVSIPWHVFFKSNFSWQNPQQQSGVKKTCFKAKTPRKKPSKPSKEKCFQNEDTFSSMQPLPLTAQLTESCIPELIFPNFNILTVPKTSLTTESLSTEPLSTEPLSTVPLTTEPLTTESLSTVPLTTEPLTTESLTTESYESCLQNSSSQTLSKDQNESCIPELIFPNFNIPTVPKTSLTTESLSTEPLNTVPLTTQPLSTVPLTTESLTTESYKSCLQNSSSQTLSKNQNDLLLTAMALVHSPENSVDAIDFSLQEIGANQSSPLPEILVNQFPDHLASSLINQDQQKQNAFATAIKNSLIAIDTLQNNFINELEKIKIILREFLKTP